MVWIEHEFSASRLSVHTTHPHTHNHISTCPHPNQTKSVSVQLNAYQHVRYRTTRRHCVFNPETVVGALVFLAAVILFIVSVRSIFVLLTIVSLQHLSTSLLCAPAAKRAEIKMLIWCHQLDSAAITHDHTTAQRSSGYNNTT